MRNVLFTGGSGFIGRNTIPRMTGDFTLFCPNRFELNLYDEQEVREYISSNKIDIVIHSANPNPAKNILDKQETMFEDSIRMFMNLYRAEDCYKQMYTIGSGAEYDKSKTMCSVTEEEEFRSVPYDSYGLAKFTINRIISSSEKQCNLRIFGCYGPTDFHTKFITHAIRCCLDHRPITIRQNCMFDYMHVYDLASIFTWFIENTPHYRSYNVCTGKRISLGEIAKIVKRKMSSESEIIIEKDGWNNEYTATNSRLISEMGSYDFIPLDRGIDLQIEYETNNR